MKIAIAIFSLMGLALFSSSCQHSNASPPPRQLTVKQNWELKPGHLIGGHLISGGLGDVSIEMRGKSIYAPFPGTLQAHSVHFKAGTHSRANSTEKSSEKPSEKLEDSFSSPSTPNRSIQCAIFSSPELPAYVLRLCGIQRPKFGELEPGDTMGKGQTLQFAALRKQPNGEWAIVEPASDILERILSKS
ncbi:MAG: hypothetical protein AAGD25_25045 [Cyanobacteria bacterium P01_F01_bin.150]